MLRATNRSTQSSKSTLALMTTAVITVLLLSGCSSVDAMPGAESASGAPTVQVGDQAPSASPTVEPPAAPEYPAPPSANEWCGVVFETSDVSAFNDLNGIEQDADAVFAQSAVGPNGPGVTCMGDHFILTAVDTADEAAAARLTGELTAFDQLFPDDSTLGLSDAAGNFSYLADSSATLSSLDLMQGTRVVTIQHTLPLAQLDESVARNQLLTMASVALLQPLPPNVAG